MAVSWCCGERSTCAFAIGLSNVSAVVVGGLRWGRGHSRGCRCRGAAAATGMAHLKDKKKKALAEGAVPHKYTIDATRDHKTSHKC